MHPAPGLVCSDRLEGCLLSCFDPSATQTVPTVCVRRSGMAVQGPPLRALPVSPCVHGGTCPSSAELPEFLQKQECGTTETVSETPGAYGIRSCSHATRIASNETTSALATLPGPVSYINRLGDIRSHRYLLLWSHSSSHCALFTSRGSSIVRPTRSHDSSHSPESGDSIPRRSG